MFVCDATCHQGKEPEKFFVSAGFALTHASSVTDVTAIEAVRVEEIDGEAVRAPFDLTAVVHREYSTEFCQWFTGLNVNTK